MHVEVGRYLAIDAVQKALEFDGAVAAVSLADNAAAGNAEGGEQGGDPMAPIVVGPALRHSGSQRQDGLGAVKSLDLRLLVDAEHEGCGGRIQVQADDVTHLLNELRIIGELEVLDPMRLQTERLPDSVHGHMADLAGRGQAARAPMGGVPRRLLQRHGQHRLDLFVSDLARRPAARLVEEPGQAALDIARAPFADGVVGDAKFGCNLGAWQAISAAKDDARPSSQAVAGLGALAPTKQLDSVFVGNRKGSLVGSASLHCLNLNCATRRRLPYYRTNF